MADPTCDRCDAEVNTEGDVCDDCWEEFYEPALPPQQLRHRDDDGTDAQGNDGKP